MTGVIVLLGLAAATMLLLGILAGYLLGWANKTFHVEVDPRQERVLAALPGTNCGGCGYVGCNEYAEAVVHKGERVDKCTVGGKSCAEEVAKILGVELKPSWPARPIVHCGARYDDRLKRNEYLGEQTCSAANLISGVQGCAYGCLGLDDCELACAFDAIHVIDGLAAVDYEKCVGCGACERACPRHIISLVPFKAEKMLAVACSNKDFGKDVKAVCKVGCLGCGLCQKLNDLFHVVDNLSSIDYDRYDPNKVDELRAAVEKCPMKRLIFVGKPTEKDLAAVADRKLPAVIEADFKTTADKAGWWG
jgi:RnfABCDGE-type electron transport complex B subunit